MDRGGPAIIGQLLSPIFFFLLSFLSPARSFPLSSPAPFPASPSLCCNLARLASRTSRAVAPRQTRSSAPVLLAALHQDPDPVRC